MADLPTGVDIEALPRWAQVAFAARCARRTLPLFKANWPKAPDTLTLLVRRAITVAENSATAGADSAAAAAAAARTAAAAADDAADAADTALGAALGYALGAAYAARAAADAAYSAYAAYDVRAAAAARAARAAAAARAATTAGHLHTNRDVVGQAVLRDFGVLRGLAREQSWTDDTPVPAEVFGPMWPEGRPERWPDEAFEQHLLGLRRPRPTPLQRPESWADEALEHPENGASERESATQMDGRRSETLRISVTVSEFADEEVVVAELVNLYRALNAWHIAAGGSGLQIEDWDILVPEHTPAEVL